MVVVSARVGGMIRDLGGDGPDRRPHNDGRSVIGAAFELLDYVGALEPARLLDLAEATGIPVSTVHRLLKQLIEVGAVQRDGARYCLGASLLGLGARVTPERRLRDVARRPLAELAASTGAAVSLSATIGGDAVFLDILDARVPLGLPGPGSAIPPGTAPARVHTEIGCLAPVVDAGGFLAHISCVAVAVPLGRGEVAAVTTLVAGARPSPGLLAATRATGTRIAVLLNAPTPRMANGSPEISAQREMGGR
jgi:DNA-binding Lrp family transcriptional regulator